MSRHSSHYSVYLEALMDFTTPATAKQVYEKAKEMFGEQVTGDKTSCRQSLERYVLRGKAEKQSKGHAKHGNLYQVSMAYVDPISTLTIENRTLKAEVERLRKRLAELEA